MEPEGGLRLCSAYAQPTYIEGRGLGPTPTLIRACADKLCKAEIGNLKKIHS